MELVTLNLTQDIPYHVPVAGKYFRILNGTGKFSIDTDSGINSNTLAGLGCDLRSPISGDGFTFVNVTALGSSQTVDIIISDFPVTDSRLSGDVDINGVLSVVNAGGSDYAKSSATIAATSSAEIIAQSTARASAILHIDGDLHVWKDNTVSATDLVLPAGYHTIENTSALWAYNSGAVSVNVKVLEELK